MKGWPGICMHHKLPYDGHFQQGNGRYSTVFTNRVMTNPVKEPGQSAV
jgi:hypothetical protein